MRYIRTICIIVIVAIITSCRINSQEKTQLLKEFKLSIIDNPPLSDWSDFITDIDYIPLETTSEAIMGEIHKIIIKNGKIYIKCFKKGGIFIFNTEGRLIKRICLHGKAPFQVNYLFDFSIAPNGNIYALDHAKLLTFDSDGNTLKEVFFQPYVKDIGNAINICVHNADTIYLWHQSSGYGNNFHLSMVDINGKVRKLYIPYSIPSLGTMGFVQCGSGEWVVTTPILNDTIRVVNKGKIEEKYVFNITENDKDRPPLVYESAIEFTKNEKLFEYAAKHGLSLGLSDIVLNSDFIFVNLDNLSKGLSRGCLINVHTGSVNYFAHPSEFDNIFYPKRLYLSDNNRFLTSFYAYEVTDLISRNKTKCTFLPEKRRLELLEKLKKIKESDNPVLMMVTLQK